MNMDADGVIFVSCSCLIDSGTKLYDNIYERSY